VSNLSATVVNDTTRLSGSLMGSGLAGATMFTTAIKSIGAVHPVVDMNPTAPVPAPIIPVPAPALPVPAPTLPAGPRCLVLVRDVEDLHLDLRDGVGLVVGTDRMIGLVLLVREFHLIIGGAPGPGALLGNLLCDLTGGPHPR
jgi:hypothetical protein